MGESQAGAGKGGKEEGNYAYFALESKSGRVGFTGKCFGRPHRVHRRVRDLSDQMTIVFHRCLLQGKVCHLYEPSKNIGGKPKPLTSCRSTVSHRNWGQIILTSLYHILPTNTGLSPRATGGPAGSIYSVETANPEVFWLTFGRR